MHDAFRGEHTLRFGGMNSHGFDGEFFAVERVLQGIERDDVRVEAERGVDLAVRAVAAAVEVQRGGFQRIAAGDLARIERRYVQGGRPRKRVVVRGDGAVHRQRRRLRELRDDAGGVAVVVDIERSAGALIGLDFPVERSFRGPAQVRIRSYARAQIDISVRRAQRELLQLQRGGGPRRSEVERIGGEDRDVVLHDLDRCNARAIEQDRQRRREQGLRGGWRSLRSGRRHGGERDIDARDFQIAHMQRARKQSR